MSSDSELPASPPFNQHANITVNEVKRFFSWPSFSCLEPPPVIGHVESYEDEPSTPKARKDVHISEGLIEEFMELAKDNTEEDLETCGILGASLEEDTYYITALVIPKQESTSNTCQALNEEEIHDILDRECLYPAGWIHTHPSQSCYLSSVDVHTQYSYQIMLPEAIAIVMAPTDHKRKCGIFRLSDPGGINLIRECEERGFHSHPETEDGSPIFESCSDVYVDPDLAFNVFDIRSQSGD